MATYVNDLRLKEIATGDESGTWGTSTNTNLELIGEALSFGTEAITTNADTHTTTVADGASDPGRAMYLKYTGTLDSACTITIAPNTISRMQFIENGTSGSQNIIISQGSGANITIPPGDTKAVYLDGAGSGAAVVDAFASLSVVDLKVQDDLTVTDDVTISGDIDVDGTTNLDVVDIDGALTQDGGAVFNEDSADVDFRVESNGNTHMLFVDAGDNHINIGTATDAGGILNISGSSDGDMTALTLANTVTGGTNDTVALELQLAGTSGQVPASTLRAGKGEDWTSGTSRSGFLAIEAVLDGTNRQMAFFGSDGDGSSKVSFSTNNSEAMRIDSSQKVGIGVTSLGNGKLIIGSDQENHIRLENSSELGLIGIADDGEFVFHVHGDNSDDVFKFLTGSGTGTERVRIDNSGNVGVGQSTPEAKLHIEAGSSGASYTADGADQLILEHSDSVVFDIRTPTDAQGILAFSDTTRAVGLIGYNHSENSLRFSTSSTERMRITSGGHLAINATTTDDFPLRVDGGAGNRGINITNISFNADRGAIRTSPSGNTTYQAAVFLNHNSSNVGTITVTSANTAFNTSSDYRLKENITTLENGLDRLNQLKPVKFNWKENGQEDEGFIAHEVDAVFPYAVSGEKDAVNENGGIQGQQMDYGRITPLLVKAIQEQQTIIDDLKARITTLEGE